MEKKLAKIKTARFGIGGYQDGMIGLFLNFEGKSSWGVGTMKCAWDSTLIKHSPSCKWTEEDRTKQYADIVRFISQTLADANVDSVEKLIGIPVECEFDGMTLKSWRVLTEVL